VTVGQVAEGRVRGDHRPRRAGGQALTELLVQGGERGGGGGGAVLEVLRVRGVGGGQAFAQRGGDGGQPGRVEPEVRVVGDPVVVALLALLVFVLVAVVVAADRDGLDGGGGVERGVGRDRLVHGRLHALDVDGERGVLQL